MLFLLLMLCFQPQPFEAVKDFSPALDGDEYLTLPHAVDLAADGRLFVVDARRDRVLLWNKDGSFAKGFGRSGEGPGELRWPMNVAVIGEDVWVADGLRRLHRYNLDGEFQNMVRTELYIRTMAAASPDKLWVGVRSLDPESRSYTMELHSLELATGDNTRLKVWDNPTVKQLEGNNDVLWKAYGYDIHVGMNDTGGVYAGFSNDPMIRKAGESGKMVDGFRFEAPPLPYLDSDRELVKEMSFPNGQGGRFKMSDLPNWRWDFEGDKAPFTQFTLKGNKILFFLTPLGSIQGVGSAYHLGDYFVWDRQKKKMIDRGRFEYPEDSKIFLVRGKIIGLLIDEEGEYAVKALQLDSF